METEESHLSVLLKLLLLDVGCTLFAFAVGLIIARAGGPNPMWSAAFALLIQPIVLPFLTSLVAICIGFKLWCGLDHPLDSSAGDDWVKGALVVCVPVAILLYTYVVPPLLDFLSSLG